MSVAHDPWRVRMNLYDGTYHCAVHGLLSEDDLRATLARAGMNAPNVDSTVANPILTWPLTKTFIDVVEWMVIKVRRQHCDTVMIH